MLKNLESPFQTLPPHSPLRRTAAALTGLALSASIVSGCMENDSTSDVTITNNGETSLLVYSPYVDDYKPASSQVDNLQPGISVIGLCALATPDGTRRLVLIDDDPKTPEGYRVAGGADDTIQRMLDVPLKGLVADQIGSKTIDKIVSLPACSYNPVIGELHATHEDGDVLPMNTTPVPVQSS